MANYQGYRALCSTTALDWFSIVLRIIIPYVVLQLYNSGSYKQVTMLRIRNLPIY